MGTLIIKFCWVVAVKARVCHFKCVKLILAQAPKVLSFEKQVKSQKVSTIIHKNVLLCVVSLSIV